MKKHLLGCALLLTGIMLHGAAKSSPTFVIESNKAVELELTYKNKRSIVLKDELTHRMLKKSFNTQEEQDGHSGRITEIKVIPLPLWQYKGMDPVSFTITHEMREQLAQGTARIDIYVDFVTAAMDIRITSQEESKKEAVKKIKKIGELR